MSREDHPSYQSCCPGFARITPSGGTQWFHSFFCRTAPNKLKEPNRTEVITTRAAEVASAAERYADTPLYDWQDPDGYVAAHLDDDDDPGAE